MPPQQVSAYLAQELPDNPNADAGDREEPPDLIRATDRLEAIEFVGLTENIDAVLATMAEPMNYHPALYFPFINENPDRADPLQGLTLEELAILRDQNDLDLPLYGYAKRLIERRAFERDMRRLIANGIYTVPAGSFEIPVSGVIPGSGWYEPEQDNGLAWRWTGPGRHFTIEVPLRDDASYRLTMDFGSPCALGPAHLSAEVNDEPVALHLTREGAGYHSELVIPQYLLVLNFGFCRIRFETRETTRPAPPEIRALGISVRRVIFECLDA
jgi:hypothetical protein